MYVTNCYHLFKAMHYSATSQVIVHLVSSHSSIRASGRKTHETTENFTGSAFGVFQWPGFTLTFMHAILGHCLPLFDFIGGVPFHIMSFDDFPSFHNMSYQWNFFSGVQFSGKPHHQTSTRRSVICQVTFCALEPFSDVFISDDLVTSFGYIPHSDAKFLFMRM